MTKISVTAKVSWEQYESNGFGITAEFEISLPELLAAEAGEIIVATRLTCPYSKSFAGAEDLPITLKT